MSEAGRGGEGGGESWHRLAARVPTWPPPETLRPRHFSKGTLSFSPGDRLFSPPQGELSRPTEARNGLPIPLSDGLVSQADPGHLHPLMIPLLPSCAQSLGNPGGSGACSPLRQQHQDTSQPLWTLLFLLPLDVQQHEYSYFLFKTNLERSLSKRLLITKKRLQQELIDRPTWPLLKNKLATGSATYKGKAPSARYL